MSPFPTRRPDLQQQQDAAVAEMNRQAAEQDFIAQQHKENAKMQQMQEEAARDAARAQKAALANAKRQGVKIAPDATGAETIQRHEDGQPVYEAGFVGEPQINDKGGAVSYRDARGQRYEVPFDAIRSEPDPTGETFYSFDVTGPDGQKQTMRQPAGTKPLFRVDPGTGSRIVDVTDPTTGSVQPRVVGVDPLVANKAAIEKRKNAAQLAQNERSGAAEELRLQLAQKDTLLQPVRQKLREAQEAADKLAKEKVTYVQKDGDETTAGMYQVVELSDGSTMDRKLTKPDEIAKADAWVKNRAMTEKALADAKTAHDPAAAEIQAMQERRDALALETLKENRRAQAEIRRMEEAAKAGKDVTRPEWQQRAESLAADPRMSDLATVADMEAAGDPLAPDVQAAALPETAKMFQRVWSAGFQGQPKSLLQGMLDGVTALNPGQKPKTTAEAQQLAAKSLGIADPASVSIEADPLGHYALRYGNDEFATYSPEHNRIHIIGTAAGLNERAAELIANADKDGVPVYLSNTYPAKAEQPFNSAELRGLMVDGLAAVQSADTQEAAESALAAAGLSQNDIRGMVRAGKLSVQDGRMMLDKFHGVEAVNYSRAAVQDGLGRFIASQKTAKADWDAGNKAAVISRYMDSLASKATSGNVVVDRGVFEQRRQELLSQHVKEGVASKVGGFMKELIMPMVGIGGQAIAYVPQKLAKWSGYETEAGRLSEQQFTDWQKRTGSFIHKMMSRDDVVNSLNDLRAWAQTANPGDTPPDDLAEKIAGIAYDGYHELTDDAAKALNTSRDTFNVNRDPMLKAALSRYLTTADPAAFDQLSSLLMLDGQDRKTQAEVSAYISAPRVATPADVVGRAKGLGIDLTPDKANALMGLTKRLESADEKAAQGIITQAGKILGLDGPEAAETFARITADETDDPDSAFGLLKGGFVAGRQELATEALFTGMEAGMAWVTAGAATPEIIAERAARQGIKTGIRAAIRRNAQAAFTKLADSSAAFAKTAAALGKARETVGTGLANMGEAFAKTGIKTPTFGQPLTKLDKARNAAVQVSKNAAVAAPAEMTEEGVAAIGEPDPNAASIGEQMLMGAAGGLVLTPMFAGAAAVGQAWKNRGAGAEWEKRKAGYIDELNRRMESVPGFKPLTVADFDAWQGLQDNPAHTQARAAYQSALATFEQELALHQDAAAGNASLPLTPELLAARVQLDSAAKELELATSSAFMAMDELRGIPEAERPLYTGAAKAATGARDFTEAEAKALMAQGGNNAVVFQQAQVMPADVAGPPAQRAVSAPAVSNVAPGVYRLPAGVRVDVPPALLDSLVQKAPTMVDLLRQPANQTPAVQAVVAKTDAKKQVMPKAPKGKKAKPATTNATTPTPTKQDAGPLPVGTGNATGTPAQQPANPTPAPVAPEPGKPGSRETAPTTGQREPVTPSIETPMDNAPAPLPQDLNAKLAALTKGVSVSFTKEEKDTVNASWGEASPFNVPEAFKKGKTAKSARDLPMGSRIDDDTPVAKEEVLFIVEAIAEAEMQRRNTLAKRRLVVIGGHVANDGGAGYFWDTNTVAVNPQRLARMVWAEMLAAKKTPTRRLVAEQTRGVITHEIVHAAQFEAARLAYSKIKSDKPAFEEWVKGYYEAIWNSLDPELQQATIAAYGTILANAPEWHRGVEASRMLLETGTMERMSEAIIRHLENVLAVLKRWYDDVVNEEADNAIVADEIERVQAVLDAWNSGGTVKPDAKKKPAKPKAQKPEAAATIGVGSIVRSDAYRSEGDIRIDSEQQPANKDHLSPWYRASTTGGRKFELEQRFITKVVTPSQAIPPATTQTADVQDQTEAQGQRQGQAQEVLAPASPETAPRESELSNPDMGSAGAVDGLPPIEKAPPGSPELAKPTIAADKHWLFDTQAGDVAGMTEGRNVFIVAHFTKLKDAKDALAKINQGKDGPARIEAWLAKPKKEGGKVVSKWAVFIPNVTQDFVDEFNAIKVKDQAANAPKQAPLPAPEIATLRNALRQLRRWKQDEGFGSGYEQAIDNYERGTWTLQDSRPPAETLAALEAAVTSARQFWIVQNTQYIDAKNAELVRALAGNAAVADVMRNPRNDAQNLRIYLSDRIKEALVNDLRAKLDSDPRFGLFYDFTQGRIADDAWLDLMANRVKEQLGAPAGSQPSFKVGDRVQANEGTGKIAELRGGQAKLTLDNGTMSLWIPVDRLQAVQEPVSPETPSGRFSARAKEEARQQFEGLFSSPVKVDKSTSGGQSSPYEPGIDSPAQLGSYDELPDTALDREELAALTALRERFGSGVLAAHPRQPLIAPAQTPREKESRRGALSGFQQLSEELRAVFGKRVLFVKRRGKPLPDNGYNVGTSRNVLAVDIDAVEPVSYLVGHELGHAIEAQSPGLYRELSTALLEMAGDTTAYRARLTALGYKESELDAEIINDFIGSQFMEPAFWRDLAGRDKSLFERMAAAAVSFIQSILRKAAVLSRDVRPLFSEIDKARALLVEVLTTYATNAQFPQMGALAGELSRSTSGMKQQPIPADRLPGFIKLAQTLIAEGVRTPQDLAAFLEETFPGGKARPFSQALWNAVGMVSPDLSSTPDWTRIYGDIKQPLPDVPEPVEASQKPDFSYSTSALPQIQSLYPYPWKGFASTNEGGRLAVDAGGQTQEEAKANALSLLVEKFNARKTELVKENNNSAAESDTIRDLILSDDSRAKKAQAMKKLAEERGETLKQTQEFVESRLVQIADEVARNGNAPAEQFSELVDIYEKQPLFSARTSTSMENQAYSTPAPMAFALRHMTGVTPQTSVYDATAGNGMLAIGSDLKNSVANEIDETRLEGLRRLGIGTITTKDATDPTGAFQNRPKAQTVHLNPPFGGIPNVNFDGYGIRKLEHIISLQALKEGMADNGTAAIILGATMNNQEQVKGAQWVFENYLYAHYNVVDNFEVSGELYGNQGAKWPVRILVIAGKKAVPTRNQDLAPKTVDRLDTWPDVWARAERTRYEVARQRQTLGTDGQTTAPSGNPAGNTGTADTRPIPDSQRPAASTPSGSGVRGGNAGGQPRPGATGTGGFGLAAPGATEQPADAGTSVQPATGGRKPAASVGDRGGRRPSSAANAPSGSSQTGGATDASGQNPANAGSVTPRPERRKAAATATQVPYDPASNGSPFETLVPRGIGESLQTALAEIVANRGPIDQYVADRLDMSVEDLHKAMAAEQIDGVAMAIYQMETGGALIIGDETGIGKGRQAASLIRYAILQGKIPVFFTKDPKLFSDMWGDLKDIGTTVSGPNVSASDMSVRPLILGDSEKAQIKTPDNVVVLKPASNARQSTVFAAARQNGFASTGHNAIFSTYSQIRDPNARQEFLEWLAANDDVVVVLDEAHESAGDGETSMQAAFMMGGTVKRGKGSSKTEITKSGLLNGAGAMHPRGGVLYLSATFAKRPDNMPVYFRTDLRKGSDKFSQVVEAMDKGGVALQQAITEALAEAGQYTRRERDFTGVSYAMKQVTVRDEAELVRQVDAVTGVLSAIANFSKLIRAAVEDSTARTDSQSSMTDFASIVHNQVSQLLLAAKADAVVDEVVEAHKRGEKPIVALMNTMESFLSQYVDDMNIKPGQPMKLNWAALLEYALSRTLRASEKLPNGDTVIYTVDPAEHGLGMAYQRVLSAARAVNVAFPVSPIDYIIQKARAGGVEVGELTGRESGIDYTNFQTGEGTYRKFKRADKNTLVNTFNNGSLAGMLLNASGSTGLSIHAASKFKDQKPRHMIIAQPALDINVFIQTLGRIKRTGIVLLGRYPDGSAYGARYSHLTLPLNSELRPAIMAARKMKSLNANTTGESDSAVKIEAEDLMNRFGNQVVAEYLSRNPELQDALNIEVEEREDGTVVAPKDIARKFTGRMALQPNKVQGEAYAEIISDYRRAIEQAKVTGDYDLEIIVHEDWDATRTASEQIVAGTDESSIFTSSVNVEAWDMTDNRPTPSGADMLAEFTKENGSQQQLDARWQDFSRQVDAQLEEREQSYRQRLTEAQARITTMAADDPAMKDQERFIAALERNLSGVAVKKARWRDTQRRLDDIIDEAGRPVMLENAETQEMDYGMLTQIRFPDITDRLRIAPSAFKMTYLLNRPGGRIYPTLAQFKPDGYTQARSQYSLDDMTGDRGGRRERRTLLVGSPIRAYGATGGKGKVVRFKARDGSLVTGILMPRSWNISNLAEDPRKELADAGAVEKYMRDLGWTPGFVESGDSVRIHAANGTFRITAPSARRTGGEIFLDDQLREIVGDFIRNGQRMTARIDSISDVPRVAARVMQLTGKRFKGQDVARVRKANGVDENADMDSPARTAKPKSAVKAAATEAWNRYLEQSGSSPSVNQISRDQWLNRIDQEEGRSLSSAPAPRITEAAQTAAVAMQGTTAAPAAGLRSLFNPQAKRPATGERRLFDRPNVDPLTALIAKAYRAVQQGQSSVMVPIRAVFQRMKAADPALTVESYLAAIQAADERGEVMLEAANTTAEQDANAPFVVPSQNGPGIRMAWVDRGGDTGNRPPTTHIMPDGYELTAPGMHMLASAPVRAYHGTPHKVDRFRTDKIGTGEGAQAYGWGLYFAENEAVAASYFETLSRQFDNYTVGGVPADDTDPVHRAAGAIHAFGSRVKATAQLEQTLAAFRARPASPQTQADIGRFEATLAVLKSRQALPAYEKAGGVYTVELLADEEEFISWDDPLSKQSSVFESGPNRIARNLQFLADFSEGKTITPQLLRSLDAPTYAKMLSSMFGAAQYLQIADAIVGFVPVDVVDFLAAKQLSPQMLLHDEAMLADLLSGSSADINIPVWMDSSSTAAYSVANKIAKKTGASSLAGLSQKLRAASKTGALDLHKSIIARLGQNATGEDYYSAFVGVAMDEMGGWNQPRDLTTPSRKVASEYLASIGIPGIRYLDGQSRVSPLEIRARKAEVAARKSDAAANPSEANQNALRYAEQALADLIRKDQEGTRNYVIFDENLVRILKENGKPVSEAPLASAPAPKKPNRATQAMRDIIEALPPPHREVLRDLLVNGLTPEQAADAYAQRNNGFKLSLEAIGNILRRGEAHIRLMLDRAPTKPTVQVQDGIVKATDGRPDRALAGNAVIAAATQRAPRPEEVTHAEMQELARRLFDVAPADAETLVRRYLDSNGTDMRDSDLSAEVQAIMREAHARNAAAMLMQAAGQLYTIRKTTDGTGNSHDLVRLAWSWFDTGTATGRALGMRRDPFDTPEERAAYYLQNMLLTPPESIHNELRRNPANRDRILAAWAKRADQIKGELLAHGIDLNATFADHAEEQKLVEETIPEPVKPALARAPKKTRQLVKAIMQGLTPAEAIRAAGLTAKAAFRAYQDFRATLNQTGTEAAQAMRDQLLRSAPAPGADFAANLGLPDLSEAEWLDAVQNNKPLRTTPETEKLKQHREKAKKAGTLDLKNSNSTRKAIRAIEERKSNAFEKISEFWRASILSGPQTHVVNLVSGLTYGAYEASFKKLAAGVQGDIARMFGAKPDAASLADIPAMIAASLPSIKLAFLDGIAAWKSETRAFENYALQLRDDNGELFKEQFNPALKGALGKVMRGISFRLMGAADEFVKSFFTRIEVAAQARQIARNEGKTGHELAKAIQELMEPGSLAWERALGQAKKITFQTEIGSGSASIDAIDGLAQLISRTKKGDFGKPLKGLAHFTFPFVDTPTNIFKAGVTMSPVGGLLALVDMIRAYNRYRKGNTEEAAKIYNAARALDDLTNQIVAWGFILGLSHLVKPGDDEDETPYITGTIPWRSTSPGERELAYRTAPPQSIRIGDRWISYKRLDPFASALAFTVDAIKEFQSGKPIDEVGTKIGLGMMRNMQDKTFLQGVSDVVNAVQDPERFGTKWATNIATGFIPNLIRQPIRTADEVFRETDLPNDLGFWDALGRRMGYGIYPQGAMPAITVWGEPARKDTGTGGPNTDWMLRLLSPADMRAANVDMLDVALLRYNATHQDGDPRALFGVTAPSRELQRTIGGQVIKISLDDAEYEDFITKAGKAARQAIGTTYEGRDLTEQDVDRIKDIIARAHETFRNAAFVQAVQKRGGLNALANTSK